MCGMVVEHEVDNSIQTSGGLTLNKVNWGPEDSNLADSYSTYPFPAVVSMSMASEIDLDNSQMGTWPPPHNHLYRIIQYNKNVKREAIFSEHKSSLISWPILLWRFEVSTN